MIDGQSIPIRSLLFFILIFMLSSGVGALDLTVEGLTNSTTISGETSFNITNSSGTFSNITTINITRNGTKFNSTTSIGTHYTNLTGDTTNWSGDALYRIVARAWNSTGFNSSVVRELIVDNTGPTFLINSPSDGDMLDNNTALINVSNVSDETPIDTVYYGFENSSGVYSIASGNTSTNGWTELTGDYTSLVKPDVLVDGNHTFKVNATDTQGNLNQNQLSVSINQEPPSITFNDPVDSDAIGGNTTINVSLSDDGASVNDSTAEIAVETDNGNRTVQNNTGWSSLATSGAYYTATINTTAFSEATNIIWVNVSDTSGFNNVSGISVTFDNTKPTIDGFTVNETTGTDKSAVVRLSEATFKINASDSSAGPDSCRVDVVAEDNWTSNSYTESVSFGMSAGSQSDFVNSTADLTGHQGNFTFNAVCNDTAGNTAETNEVTADSGSGTAMTWFPFDAAPPVIDLNSVSPANGSWTNNDSPTLNFDIEDYTGINQSSVELDYDGSTYNESNTSMSVSFSSNNTTASVSFSMSGLSDGKHAVKPNATEYDHGSSPVRSDTARLTVAVDTTEPDLDYSFSGTSKDRDGTTWYDKTVDVGVSCSDSTSSVDDYSVSNNDASTSGSGSSITVEAEDNTETRYDLTISCTDTAGNENSTTDDVSLDNRDPQISRTPSPGAALTRVLSTTVDIDIELTDNGIGFKEADLDSWIDPEFEGSSVGENGSLSNDNTTMTISWSETLDSAGIFDLGLAANSATIKDQFGNRLSVSSWTFEIIEGDAFTEGDLSFTNTDDAVSLERDGSGSTTVTLENNGNKSVDANITAELDINTVSASLDSEDVSLDAGDSEDITVDLAATDFIEAGVLTVEAESDEEVVSTTIDVETDLDPISLRFYGVPQTVETMQGTTKTFEVDVENTGDTAINDADISISPFDITTDDDPLNLPFESNTTINVSLTVPDDARVGFTNATITVSGNDKTGTATVTVKIQPGNDETKAQIESTYQSLKDEVDSETLQSDLSEARTAMDDGDYATANQILADVQAAQELTSQDVENTGSGRSWLMNIVIAAIIIASLILIFMLYRTYSEESEDGDGYDYGSEASNYVEKIGTQFDAAASTIITDLDQLWKRIKNALTEDEESDEETRRKRIRFDDI